ncbi:unnamed protein product [Rotaria magnacalcarata]|uniref:Uncharacterized protein n=2 Tax=Rotaria magnacalcarata TaxID=392030 RepID=A0A819FBR9_9BILA|nr:unnamed protein product [Rotaria magnacalcarata]CAF2132397.1 unnamed protein product [Rotaria magnacalcarata]CAF3816750.1 unnamed protein product [Rotaria magnacalcarata]CAF3863959.1 unnamed protein product [Rotaria magnacalcarata]
MATSTSTEINDDHEENDPILTANIAALTLQNRISQPTTTLIVDSIPENISSLSSDSSAQNQNNHHETEVIRPFNDPALVIQQSKSTSERWLIDFDSPKSAPQGAYSVLSQAVKKLVSERTACRFGCRGANCKYERSDYWRPEQMAINGIYSNWITNNILACSRPTSRHNDLKKLFHEAGIRAIFNLETPDEHIHCGHGNHSSGYAYDPAEFMSLGIFIYNYAMEDYGTVKVETILDIMKVMSFAMKQGKIAVHCHAGLGRTGFVICSYLVHEYRMTAHNSIHYIRARRPGSVQMTKQIEVVEEYEQFLIPKRRVFTDCADANDELLLDVHLKNQQAFIHGRDAFIYKWIPRVLFVCAARLIELCTGYRIDMILLTLNRRVKDKPVFVRENLQTLTAEEKATWLDFAPSFFYEHERLSHSDFSPYKQIINCMILSIQEDFLTSEQQLKVLALKQKINKVNNGVDEIFEEADPCIISALLWTWLRLLKHPVIAKEDLELFTEANVRQPLVILEKLNKPQRGTIELLAKMLAYIRRFAVSDKGRLLVYCIIHFLTHYPLPDTNELKTLTVDYDQLRLFLISKKANYQNKKQQTNVENIVSTTSLNQELLDSLELFFISIATQFEQH